MSRSLRFSRITASLLMAVVLLQFMLPLAKMQHGGDSRSNWIEICASTGSQWLALSKDGESQSSTQTHAEHPCAFCIADEPPERFDTSAWLSLKADGHDKTRQIIEPPRRFAGHAQRARAPPTHA